MFFREQVAVGLTEVIANRLRSTLTLLGIVIGVSAIVAIVSLGEGLRRAVVADFARVGGATSVTVKPPTALERLGGMWVKRRWQEHLTTGDLQAMTSAVENVHLAVPIISGRARLQHGKTALDSRYVGTSPDYNEGFGWPVIEGRSLTVKDVQLARRVVLLGHRVADDLFHRKDPIGAELQINGVRHNVVGVLEHRIRFGQEEGNQVVVPYTTLQRRLSGYDNLSAIALFAKKLEDVDGIVNETRLILGRRHKHGDEFRLETGNSQIEAASRIVRVMQHIAVGIAGVSLLVGGIGVMNIMLVSVMERRHEIAIRKSLGAKPRQIMIQFLTEAMTLCLIGGMSGLTVGMGLGLGIEGIVQHLAPGSAFVSVFSLGSIAWALGFAIAAGLLFGVYPAVKAARLDAAEMLRSV